MEQKYLVNKTTTHLSCKTNFLLIPPGGFVKISPYEENEESVAYAVSRDWAEITSVRPAMLKEAVSEVEITTVDPYKGLTLDELKAEQKAKAEAAEVETGQPEAEAVVEPEVKPSTDEAKPRKTKAQ